MENSVQDLKQLPYNIEAEKSVLGSILIDPSKFGSIEIMLDADDFYKKSHQLIYNAMLVLSQNNHIIDVVTLADQLAAYDELENVGGHDQILELSYITPSSEHIEYYANIVKTKSVLRKLIHASNKISQLAYDEGDDLTNIVDQSERLILSISDQNQQSGPVSIRQVVGEAFDKIMELGENSQEIVGLPTGFIDLDRLTTGFQPDQLIILAARPSVGKTAFALNIAQNVATKAKVPCVIFSLEMGAVDLVNRMLCSEGNINATNLRTGQLTNDEWSSLSIAVNTLREAPIFIDDTAGIKVGEIRAKCRRLKQENPDLGLVVIDYLQLIEGSGKENRQQEVSDISRQLKKLAKELSLPVIALSQLSRGVEHRQDKRPVLSDIRESGSIEQDADIVAFLYRDDYYQNENVEGEDTPQDSLPDNTIEIIIAKNRNGARDTVPLLFKKEYNKFSTLSYQNVPQF